MLECKRHREHFYHQYCVLCREEEEVRAKTAKREFDALWHVLCWIGTLLTTSVVIRALLLR